MLLQRSSIRRVPPRQRLRMGWTDLNASPVVDTNNTTERQLLLHVELAQSDSQLEQLNRPYSLTDFVSGWHHGLG